MLVKKEPSSSPKSGIRKRLVYLQARKSAIDTLIQSLEDYERFRSRPTSNPKLKTA
jgi:hypothetical protein